MSSQLVRVASFAAWPSTAAVSSLALAGAGFKYSGHGESTVCADCQLIVDSWQRGYRPDKIHAQRSPNCAFVQQHLQDRIVSNILISAQSASTAPESENVLCFVNRDHPDFERLKDEAVRLSTFFDWPERVASIVRPGDVAKAGLFYTGQTDRVQCAFCRGYLRNWVQGDIPADEHRRLFPDCPFVRQQFNDARRVSREYVCLSFLK